MRIKSLLALSPILLAACLVAQPPPDGVALGNVSTVRGTVTVVHPPIVTLKMDDGTLRDVKIGVNAHVMKRTSSSDDSLLGRPQPIALNDVHAGDVLMASGVADGKNLNVIFVVVIDVATVQKLAADWGVTYIAGKVTAIDADNAKLTIQRHDGKAATIQADENTSFRKARESITLADIKVGDTVTGRGAQKNGAFIAATLVVIDPNAHRGREIIRKK